MDCPKFIVSNQTEVSISLQRVKKMLFHVHIVYLKVQEEVINLVSNVDTNDTLSYDITSGSVITP